MSVESIVFQLLEDVLQSGRSPEEVCSDHAELLDEVRAKLGRINRVREELDALLPKMGSTRSSHPSLPHLGIDPRQIPGHEIAELLGRGGMGVVYKARHVRLNRPVAVKMMLSGAFAGSRELARFRREAEALAELSHPHVVQIHEAGECDGVPYFTMEFIEGGTLAEKLAEAPLPADDAASLVIKLAGAVQAAHNRGIVHRDLKPSNILMTLDGSPKVSDFGLARRLDPDAKLSRTGARLGTPSYMAPEQAAGSAAAAGPAVDIYALGAVLYELLTGRPPFKAETAAETERQVIAEEPAAPSRLNAGIPRDLETICLKCLQKDPSRRYASADELADDLSRFQRCEPITARPISMAERGEKWIRRHPGRMLAVLSSALAVIVLLASGWQFLSQRLTLAREAEKDLGRAEQALERSFWSDARAAFELAKARLGHGGPAELRRRLDRVDRALKLADRLEEIQTGKEIRGSNLDGIPGFFLADKQYEEAYQRANIGTVGDSPVEVAQRIKASGIRSAIVGTFDQWSFHTVEPHRIEWILAVARLADPDPKSGWRDRVRDPSTRLDKGVLAELARTAPFDSQSVPIHLALARRLNDAGGDGLAFLRRVHAANPTNYNAAFDLALELDKRRNPDALGYYWAAVAIHPKGFGALQNIGSLLWRQGRLAEAEQHQRDTVLRFPGRELPHLYLAITYRDEGRFDLAIDQGREAVRLNSHSGLCLAGLGWILFDRGEFDEARVMARRSLEYLPAGQPFRTVSERIIRDCDRILPLIARRTEIARGIDTPVTAAQALDFAQLCEWRWPAVAARLYATAFNLDPRSPEGDVRRFRYLAARAAVRAGFGDGQDSPLDGPDRANLRQQALGWLLAERDTWALYARLKPEARYHAVQNLRFWQHDAILGPVRDSPSIARLSESERARWKAFWTSVDLIVAGGSVWSLDSAQSYATRREWRASAENYAHLIEANPADLVQEWFEFAAVQLLSGDTNGYHRTCERLAERRERDTLRVRAYHVARSCTLAPHAVADLAKVRALSEAELKGDPNAHWSLTEQAALLHRTGQSRKAVSLLERSLDVDKRPGVQAINFLWLALAYQQLGQAEEAQRWLDKAGTWLDRFGGGEMPAGATVEGLDLHNWLEALALRQEAEALLRSSKGAR